MYTAIKLYQKKTFLGSCCNPQIITVKLTYLFYCCLFSRLKHQSPSQVSPAHMAALISVSIDLSQTPAEASRTCNTWQAHLLSNFRWYSSTDPGGMASWVGVGTWQLWVRFKHMNSWSQVQHSTTWPVVNLKTSKCDHISATDDRQTSTLLKPPTKYVGRKLNKTSDGLVHTANAEYWWWDVLTFVLFNE